MAGPVGTASEMVLYNLTLQQPSGITRAVFGSFSAPKAQEILVGRGHILELLRPDDTGKVVSILQHEIFGVIRSITPFRLVGGKTDFIVVSSDSGKIIILQYNKDKNCFEKVHDECFGKSGCRRIVPGQYLTTDPKGRAVMIAATEKSKFVYVLNRDSSAKLTISSPLEAHKSHTLTWDIVGVDVGFENPLFACIEVDYEDDDDDDDEEMKELDPELAAMPKKMLTYYELDLGLNHVTRKFTEDIDPRANKLLSVPGGNDGPGGVLILAEDFVFYNNIDNEQQEDLRTPIPRRIGTMDDSKGVLIVATATHRQKNLFFFLVQSEYGDIYKISLEYKEDTVTDIAVKYFDTAPVGVSMCVLKTGFLFVASEFGNHFLFQFQAIGQDDDVETHSNTSIEDYTYFTPRPLKNLALIDEMESLSAIMDMKVADLTMENAPQIYTLCGRGARSSLRVLRHGLAVNEMAVSELPGNPNAVWAVKTDTGDEYHKYIIVSFVNATIVLSIGETVTEVSDSGILDSTATLSVSTLGTNQLVQIHPAGIRLINADRRVQQWVPGVKKQIMQCAVNRRQVVVALSGGELVYFELDTSGALMELDRKEMGSDVACLALAPVAPGRSRAQFLAVGSYDNTVRILSLDTSDPLKQVSVQAMPGQGAQPKSLVLARMTSAASGTGASGDRERIYLYAGLQNGVMIRSVLDQSTGGLSDMRQKFLGTKPVKLFTVDVSGRDAVVALSSRSWLSYTHQNKFLMTPLSYGELEHCSSFSSEQCPQGLVAIAANTLRIVTVDSLGEQFNATAVSLRYTPRKLIVHPTTNYIITIESDNNAYPYTEKKELYKELQLADDDKDEQSNKRRKVNDDDMDMDEDDEDEEKKTDEQKELEREIMFGAPCAGQGRWGSCVRIVDPASLQTLFLHEFDNNEAAFSVCTVQFTKGGDELFLAVGTTQDLKISPRSLTRGNIHLFRFTEQGAKIELVHKTPVEDVVLAMHPFRGRLLAGVGNRLRIYELGKKKLLRKVENKGFPTCIVKLSVIGDRIYVADQCESLHFVKWKKDENGFHIFADSTEPRFITATEVLDYNTVAGADKFGNFFVCRLPANADEEMVDHMSTTKWGNTLVNGAPNKLKSLIQYHAGDTITALQRTNLGSGTEVIFYSTLLGQLGIFLPFSSREDVEFFTHLEMHLRQEHPPLCGRDHLAYRSFYFPVKDCLDGDLCEQYTSLEFSKQASIAEELVSTPADVAKRLEEIRNRVL